MFKVLIIEDDIIWQIKLQVMLVEVGFSTSLATSLAEARQVLQSTLPDVILTDIRLPDGLATDYYKINPPGVPVVFVTAFADNQVINQIIAIPFSSFYVKPFHSLTLIAALRVAYTAFSTDNIDARPDRVLDVPIRYGQKTTIPLSKIHWIEVEGNYSTIQTAERKYAQKLSLSRILPELDERFIQVNKSVIVNKDFIQRISFNNNTLTVQKKAFEIGRSFRRLLIEKYNEHL